MKRKIILLLIPIIVLTSIAVYFFIGKNDAKEENPSPSFRSEIKTSDINGVLFEVTLLDFALKDTLRFDVKITTHSGSLDFDLTEISVLEDDLGNRYQPLSWNGSVPGGHHRSGILSFPKINQEAGKIKLVIKDVNQRFFEWEIK